LTKSEPFFPPKADQPLAENGTDAAPTARQELNRSGEAGRKRGVGKMNARRALAFAAAKIRANNIGTPPIYKL